MHGYVPNLSANFYFVSLAEIIFSHVVNCIEIILNQST